MAKRPEWKTSSGNLERRFRRFDEVHCPERAKLLGTWLQQHEQEHSKPDEAGGPHYEAAKRWYGRVLRLYARIRVVQIWVFFPSLEQRRVNLGFGLKKGCLAATLTRPPRAALASSFAVRAKSTIWLQHRISRHTCRHCPFFCEPLPRRRVGV